VEVREALASDWPAVSSLLAELGRPDVRGADDEDEHRQAYERYLERPDATAFVAVDGGEVIGFIDLEFRQRLNFSTPQAWVADLVVTEGARSHGAGKALLARAMERAKEEDCWSFELESAVWRTRAHAFYEREGMTHSAHAFMTVFGDLTWPPAPR
jgi:GNAT superfamily N-acetyltransferase